MKEKILFFDTETIGLYGENRLSQFKWYGDDTVIVLDRDTDRAKEILREADTIVVHNAFYDFNCPEFEQFKFNGKLFDTLLACKYDKPCAKKFDLNSCLIRYGLEGKGEEGKSDWSGELTEEQLNYAKDDVILLEKLYDRVKHVSKIPAFRLDMRNYKYAVYYSHNGFPVLNETRLELIAKYKKERDEVAKDFPKGLNINSPKQVTEYLNIPKSDKEYLTQLDDPKARGILKLRGLDKKISTLEKKFNYPRIYGIFKPANAKSGRWTCSKRGNKTSEYQNLQQLDRDMKHVFGFEEDNDLYLVDADYTSLEMYTAAAVFNSQKMMQLLYEGKDLHRYTASRALRKAEGDVTKDERQMAKGLNFGTLYGAGVDVVSIFIHTYTGKQFPRKDVERFRTNWLNTYSDIRDYHKSIGNKMQGKKTLRVETPLGRPICAASYSEAINTPAQGFGAEVTKIALFLLHKEYPQVKIVNTVHDSITLEVKGFEEAKRVACILKKCLDESWKIGKKYIKHKSPLLDKLEMDNTAEVMKVYDGDVLWSTEL